MDGEWEVLILESAEREVDRLREDVRGEAMDAIADLSEDPFPPGHLRMRGYNDCYRIRIGGDAYRIVYRVDRKNRVVKVFRVRPRATAYRGMRNPTD